MSSPTLGLLLCTILALNVHAVIDHQTYLRAYGYLSESESIVTKDQDVSDALSTFQSRMRLPITGIADTDTLAFMKLARCANKDVVTTRPKISFGELRSKRYVLSGTVWSRTSLSYHVTKYTKQLSRKTIDKIVARAFKYWGDITPLKFHKVSSSAKADINIQFVVGDHHDNSPFDGPMGTLAHAFQPEDGEVHFDDEETWVQGDGDGVYEHVNLLQIMTHEVGHALGMGHSASEIAVMYPVYLGYVKNFHLDTDDVNGIQKMYGAGGINPHPTMPTTTTEAPSNPTGDICTNPTLDAAVVTSRSIVYGFRGSQCYTLSDSNGHTVGRSIYSVFGVDVSHLDAALNYKGNIFMFKKGQVYASRGGRSVSGYPKPLTKLFPGVPEDIDAAFVHQGNAVFVTRDNRYYQSHGRLGGGRAKQITCPISGGPGRVEAAVLWPDFATFFFNNEYYYGAYSSNKFSAKAKNLDYWINCK